MCAILLVEDHYDTRLAFAAILRSWGHRVDASDSVASGLAFLGANAVDVVLSDIGLPDRNGYDFIAEARKRYPLMATIAISAYFTAADQTLTFTLGTPVRADAVKASYRDGVLEIHVPKADEARRREIDIQVG